MALIAIELRIRFACADPGRPPQDLIKLDTGLSGTAQGCPTSERWIAFCRSERPWLLSVPEPRGTIPLAARIPTRLVSPRIVQSHQALARAGPHPLTAADRAERARSRLVAHPGPLVRSQPALAARPTRPARNDFKRSWPTRASGRGEPARN